jgi:hypothetical protein
MDLSMLQAVVVVETAVVMVVLVVVVLVEQLQAHLYILEVME